MRLLAHSGLCGIEQGTGKMPYAWSTTLAPKLFHGYYSRKGGCTSSTTEGTPGLANSTIRLEGILVAHPGQEPKDELEDELTPRVSENNCPLLDPRRVIIPSLPTLEKAVSAGIYFANLYFPFASSTTFSGAMTANYGKVYASYRFVRAPGRGISCSLAPK
jgi:hypothetical protein